LENNFYVLAPSFATYFLHPDSEAPIDAGGGQSMIVDYRGAGHRQAGAVNSSGFVAGVLNIDALRHHRQHARASNWLKDMRAELAQIIYEQPIYPKNLYWQRRPGKHEEYRHEVTERQVALMQERGIWKPPAVC
jgi:beta-ureidopropionase